MKYKLPSLLILMVMVLIGAMYWVDLSYYTDPDTGFITRGAVWYRYIVILLPVIMSLLGLRTVGPRAISVMRVKNPVLGTLFALAAAAGVAVGVTRAVAGLLPALQGEALDVHHLVLGVFFIWYGVWMAMAAVQLFTQERPSPTKSAIWGMLAALPYAAITIVRILVQPSSLYRVGMLVRCFSALLLMLWFGFLLRSLYIALPRRRVRWTYITGVFAFLFATCLELPYAAFTLMFTGGNAMDFFESLAMAFLGLAAGAVSVAIAGQSAGEVKPVGAFSSEE